MFRDQGFVILRGFFEARQTRGIAQVPEGDAYISEQPVAFGAQDWCIREPASETGVVEG